MRRVLGVVGVAAASLALLSACVSAPNPPIPEGTVQPATVNPATTTPIKHVVVIYDENVSFDHYFGTYPKAANSDGVPFTATAGTTTPTNLLTGTLPTENPNEFNPFRLKPSEAVTCDQNHSYAPEQEAADG